TIVKDYVPVRCFFGMLRDVTPDHSLNKIVVAEFRAPGQPQYLWTRRIHYLSSLWRIRTVAAGVRVGLSHHVPASALNGPLRARRLAKRMMRLPARFG